jgi:hypothetical protein
MEVQEKTHPCKNREGGALGLPLSGYQSADFFAEPSYLSLKRHQGEENSYAPLPA